MDRRPSRDIVGKQIFKSGQFPDSFAFKKARKARTGSLTRKMLLSGEALATEA